MIIRDKFARSSGLLALCGLLAACQGGTDALPCGLGFVTGLKLTQSDRAFDTTISINGQNAAMFLDTGSTFNLLTRSAASRLRLAPAYHAEHYLEGIGGNLEIAAGRSREVRLGDAHGKDLTFATVADSAVPGDADGILGMDFLYDYDMDLDFWDGRLGLYKTIKSCATPVTAMTGQLYSVPLLDPSHALEKHVESLDTVFDVTINGKIFKAVVDTGATRTLIFRDSARRAGLRDAAILARDSIHGAGERPVAGDIRISAPMSIGDLTVTGMPIVVADQTHPVDTDILLGFDFVTRVHLWISHSSHTLIMQYPPMPTPVRSE